MTEQVRGWLRARRWEVALAGAMLGCSEPAAEPQLLAKVEAGASSAVQRLESSGRPAEVENAVPEAQLASVTLSERAAQRLGVELAKVERRSAGRARVIGGELVAPPGHALVVSAPQAGTLVPAKRGGALPAPGAAVKAGEPLFQLLLLPPGDLSRAKEEVALTEARFTDARSKERRASQLLRDKAGSMRELEDAQLELVTAEKAVTAAHSRVALLSGKPLQDGELSGLTPLTVRAPRDGVVQSVLFGRGQLVSAGAPLVEIVSLDPLWVKVPVYVGDLEQIELKAPVSVRGLTDSASSPGRRAAPVSAPPSANAQAASADLFYELSNREGRLRPGERVSVTLALRGAEDGLVVPWSSVVLDVNGGAWVYESKPQNLFVRRRVAVRHVSGDLAVLAQGPPPGTVIVRAGVAEIFGTEFGNGK